MIKFLASLKLSAALMAIVAIASAKATFIESDFGREAAYDLVYAARWFEATLGLLIVSLILLFFRRWPYQRAQWGFALVHVAIVIILVSSGITRYFGYEGIMPIREGQTTDYIYSNTTHVQATVGDVTASFPVRLWKLGEVGIRRDVEIGGRRYQLGVSEYWPNFGQTYREGEGGRPGLKFGVTRGGEVQTEMLLQGDRMAMGGVQARFLEEPLAPAAVLARYGQVRVRAGGQSCTFDVQLPAGTVHECGGYRFEITEFQTDFRVGGAANADGPLVNPMIRLAITDPQGVQGERLLFALHPDFSMGHSGGEDPFAGLDLLYQISSGIEFARGGATGVEARATFPLQTMDMNTDVRGEIAAGETFAVTPEVLYVNQDQNFSFVPTDILESVVLAPGQVDDPKAGPAARLFLRDDQGNTAEVIANKNESGRTAMLGDQRVTLAYAPVTIQLPYSLYLDDFVLDTYPGSDNPATYESFVTLRDPEMGIEGRQEHIYMNHPLNHRGSKHFQSSYDPDRRGTVLSVNHDPGKAPTYFGYAVLSLGFLLILFKEVSVVLKELMGVDKQKGERGKAGKAAVAAVLALTAAGLIAPAQAQEHGPGDGHDHGAPATGYVTLSDPAREAASRLIIQDFRGRMKPLDTLARETVMKVAKRSKFEGREPVDQYLSWSTNANFWWDKPVIAVRFPGLKELLGVDASTKHVSAASLFDAQGQYRLATAVEEAHRTPDRERSKTQRKLISFDERFQILYMTFRGSMLKLYPIPGDPNHTWGTYQEIGSRLSPEQAPAYEAAFTALNQGIRSGDNARIMDGIERARALQLQYGADVLPNKGKVDAELLYNRGHIFSWMMIPLLAASFILMVVFFWNLFRGDHLQARWRNPLYSLGVSLYGVAFLGMIFAYVLRWIASGRAPLSNGHESLLFISLALALAGLICEIAFRMAAPGSLGSLLTVVILGVSMLSTFDPAIGPLVPVLVSYWLNIHVTVITASYGFLGLSALLGALILVLLLFKTARQENLREAVRLLDRINRFVLVAGLGLLSVGTLLGGVWANESWGRYWGWDAKETWSLITILVYAVVLHFRWIPALRSVWLNSAGSLAAISSVVMTYFGVNYFLSGLHSYASGDAAVVPNWVFYFSGGMLALIIVSGLVDRRKQWGSQA